MKFTIFCRLSELWREDYNSQIWINNSFFSCVTLQFCNPGMPTYFFDEITGRCQTTAGAKACEGIIIIISHTQKSATVFNNQYLCFYEQLLLNRRSPRPQFQSTAAVLTRSMAMPMQLPNAALASTLATELFPHLLFLRYETLIIGLSTKFKIVV